MFQDAGQVRRYGATQCEVCGMVYTQSEPADETMHLKFHQSLLNVLKFPVEYLPLLNTPVGFVLFGL
ncbi:hypothetical protein DPMN_083123 [Dreissena polymorpha]|uniref:N-acetyltransferase ESCO zinc-finger domain-containing protein n=1 Tax=Dreissena polymorpha TaxID=45954 RepID=A0A9D4BHE5_DREPO|nr:hypothetical protein DPMN_083123 [Dreissena polymorpha]